MPEKRTIPRHVARSRRAGVVLQMDPRANGPGGPFTSDKWAGGPYSIRGKLTPGVDNVPPSVQFYYWYISSNDT